MRIRPILHYFKDGDGDGTAYCGNRRVRRYTRAQFSLMLRQCPVKVCQLCGDRFMMAEMRIPVGGTTTETRQGVARAKDETL
jgi:hypothetical protein